ncbi:flavodoxin domain-containing protein [uncultured Phascolarctobacterium sp.]|uniref:flavodoxin domain-containing protein n=1 Tax=Phascolarctobacterium sp. TaxID=2049039 RepID=UPI0025FD2A8C|nr:flavodoxin domain-containing protein [uncultured Phascolarctobacterium sp.]
MEKIPVIYWSGTGNTKLMAEAVAEGIGAAAELKNVGDITAEAAGAYPALALGCSAMGAEVLEEYEFEPFFTALEPLLQGKKLVLFGSYGWGGSYMTDWEQRVQAAGAELVAPGLLAFGTPDELAIESCRELGAALAKA